MKAKSPIRYSKLNLRNSFKRHRDLSRRTVLKMLAVMENQQPSTPGSSHVPEDTLKTPETSETRVKEFLATGRSGRRNALPNILSDRTVDCSELPKKFENLSTKDTCDKGKDQPGPSKTTS